MSIEHETLTSLFNDIAGAIRSRTGGSAAIKADEFPDAIAAIDIHQGVETNKAVTITSLSQEVTPSSGYYSMAKVTASIRAAATIALAGVTVTDVVTVGTESSGYYPISAKIKGNVTVGTSGWYTGSSNLVASANSQVGKIAKATFAVAGNSVGCSSGGYVATDTTVGTVPTGTTTVQNRTSGGTAIGYGKEVSLSEGYYSATKFYNSIAAGSATGNAGTISSTSYTQDSSNKKKFNITIAVTAPAPTVSAGYISSGSAGSNTNRTTSITITDAQAQAAVGAGSATTPTTTITANPSLSTTYTSGSGYKMSVSATKSVTPTVSAGYVSAGTAGTITVTGEAYVPQNSFATGTAPSGVTPTSLSKNTVYKLSAGYYHEDRYYRTQADPTLSGDAAVGNVLSGKTFYSSSYTKQTGTMTNNGAVSKTLDTTTTSYTIAAGYHNGSGVVSITLETKAAAGSGDITPTSGKVLSKVTVAAGSATPGATYATLSSAGSSSTVVSSRYFKITPTASVGTPGWISSISNGTVQNYTIQAAEFEVSGASVKTKSGKAGWVDAATTVGTIANGTATVQSRTSGGTAVGYGQEVSLSAGYYSAVKFYNSISAGTIDVTDLTITPNALSGSWDSTNERYVVSQASKTATMQSTVTSAGYVSSSVGTKNTGTATVSAPSNLIIPKATFGTDGPMVGCDTAGYVPTGWVATVDAGTEGTPVATKGTASNYSISVTPSVMNVVGYIEGGEHTGTAVTVTPSDLGLTLKTALSRSGGTVSIAAGSYNTSALSVTVTAENLGLTLKTALSRSGGTVSIAANSYTTSALSILVAPEDLGLTKRTALTKSGGTVSIAANSYNTSALSVTVTRSDLGITDKSAQTYNPSTSDQTISSGYYLTGTQTIKGITAITNSTYAGYLTSSSSARTTTIKTFYASTEYDLYIYPNTSIYNYWDKNCAIKIERAPTSVMMGSFEIALGPDPNTHEFYPIPAGPLVEWIEVIGNTITFQGWNISKSGGNIYLDNGPNMGYTLYNSKYNQVMADEYILPGETYYFDME